MMVRVSDERAKAEKAVRNISTGVVQNSYKPPPEKLPRR